MLSCDFSTDTIKYGYATQKKGGTCKSHGGGLLITDLHKQN